MERGINRRHVETEESIGEETKAKLFNTFWKDLKLNNILEKLHQGTKPDESKGE